MIRIDAVWMATQPLDMRSGFDSCLARVIQVFGAAHPHSAYLFANASWSGLATGWSKSRWRIFIVYP